MSDEKGTTQPPGARTGIGRALAGLLQLPKAGAALNMIQSLAEPQVELEYLRREIARQDEEIARILEELERSREALASYQSAFEEIIPFALNIQEKWLEPELKDDANSADRLERARVFLHEFLVHASGVQYLSFENQMRIGMWFLEKKGLRLSKAEFWDVVNQTLDELQEQLASQPFGTGRRPSVEDVLLGLTRDAYDAKVAIRELFPRAFTLPMNWRQSFVAPQEEFPTQMTAIRILISGLKKLDCLEEFIELCLQTQLKIAEEIFSDLGIRSTDPWLRKILSVVQRDDADYSPRDAVAVYQALFPENASEAQNAA
jgi:hypothetical protein